MPGDPWRPWLKNNHSSLAFYVNEEAATEAVGEGFKRLPLHDLRDQGLANVVRAIYCELCLAGIKYDEEPVLIQDPGDNYQRIRSAREVLGGNGTCVDLALLFAGLCVHARLLPMLVLLENVVNNTAHALIVVDCKYTYDDWNDARGWPTEGRQYGWLTQTAGAGLWREGGDLWARLAASSYVAVDCTGFAATSDGRTQPLLAFKDACELAKKHLKDMTHLATLDIVRLQKGQGCTPYEQPSVTPIGLSDVARWRFSSNQLNALTAEILKCPCMQDQTKRTALLEALHFSPLPRDPDPARDIQAILEPALNHRADGQFFDALAQIERHSLAVQAAREKCSRIIRSIGAKEAVENAAVTPANLYKFYYLSATDSQLAASGGNLDDWLEALADMAPKDASGVSPLAEFLERVYRASEPKARKIREWLQFLTEPQRVALKERLDAEMEIAARPKSYLAIMVSTADLKPGEQPCIEAWLWRGDLIKHWVEPCNTSDAVVREKCLDILSEARARVGWDLSVEFLVAEEQLHMAPESWDIPADKFNPESVLGHDHMVVMRWRERVREPALRLNWQNRVSAIEARKQRGLLPSILWVSPANHHFASLRNKLIEKPDSGDFVGFEYVPPKNPASKADDLLLAAMVGGAPFLYVPESEPKDWNVLKNNVQRLVRLGLEEVPRGLKAMRVDARLKLAECGTLIWDQPDHLPKSERLTGL